MMLGHSGKMKDENGAGMYPILNHTVPGGVLNLKSKTVKQECKQMLRNLIEEQRRLLSGEQYMKVAEPKIENRMAKITLPPTARRSAASI